MHPSGGPDPDEVFLKNQIGPQDPRYEDMCKRLGKTPEGKRIVKHNKQNAKYQDGLNEKNPQKLSVILRAEGAKYDGDPMDRISMIEVIREHRDKNDDVTNRERITMHHEQVAEDQVDEAKAKEAAGMEKRAELKRKWAERKEERDKEAKPGRDYLNEEAIQRKGKVTPMEAREKAREEEGDATPYKLENLKEIREKELKGFKKDVLAAVAKDYALKLEEAASKKEHVDSILKYEFPEE